MSFCVRMYLIKTEYLSLLKTRKEKQITLFFCIYAYVKPSFSCHTYHVSHTNPSFIASGIDNWYY